MSYSYNSNNSKLPGVATSIFAVMSQLANENKAINLSQGFPDFDISAKLIDLVNQYMKKGFNQYAPMQGVPVLREAISKKINLAHTLVYDPVNEITITAGATQALYAAISAFVREGDEVIVFEPAYDSYVPAIKLNGGIPKYATMKSPDYHIEWEEVQKLVSHKTRMIIINSPHNPTGSVLRPHDMKALEKLTKGSDIIILSDEVYEHLIYDGIVHESICRYPKLVERSLVIGSFGKTLHATGWKMGYCLAPERLTTEFRKAHQFIVFACNTPIQYAIADFLADSDNYMHLNTFYQKKRDFFTERITGSRFKIVPSYGTYFQLLDYSDISDENEVDFAVRLTKEYKLASIPVSVFYHKIIDNKVLRFCFAKKEETLEKATEILCKI
ncbi:MAG: methionine aminotransferase [Bacteroidota bacterium]